MDTSLTLISHVLCPYVQRAAIVLAEKQVPFIRHTIDLANKLDWFLNVSPLGKTPVLLVGGTAIFESAVICEFLDETQSPPLHPHDALQRAQHRAWMEFGSSILNSIAGFYSAPDEDALLIKAAEIRQKFEQMEVVLGQGPYFAGEHFSIVDAVFGPIFRYFDVFERIADFGFFENTPKLNGWRQQLAVRPSVIAAVQADYPELLLAFIGKRNSALAKKALCLV